MIQATPQFRHDCDFCHFFGPGVHQAGENRHDVWRCEKDESVAFKVRYGHGPHDYKLYAFRDLEKAIDLLQDKPRVIPVRPPIAPWDIIYVQDILTASVRSGLTLLTPKVDAA